MIFLFLIWIFSFIALDAVGISILEIIQKHLGRKIPSRVADSFFLGLAASTVLLSYLSIFTGISPAVRICIFAIIFLLFIYHRKIITKRYSIILSSFSEYTFLEKSILILISLFIFSYCAVGFHHNDTALYHSQCIKWTESYPVMKGLGNLHHRFAFNSHFQIISTLFYIEIPSTSVSHPSVNYPLNSVAFFVLFFDFYQRIKTSIQKRKITALIFFSGSILFCLIYMVQAVGSLSNDSITSILLLYIASTIITKEEKKFQLHLAFLLSFVCISFKLSYVFIPLLFIPYFFNKNRKKRFIIFSLLAGISLLPFLIRNYYLSGFLIFPFAHLDIFNVDWKVSKEEIRLAKDLIHTWAILPHVEYTKVLEIPFQEWSVNWFYRRDTIMKVIVLLNFIISPIAVILYRKNIQIVITLIVILFNVLFWFLNAPDPRFIYGILFFGSLYPAALLLKLIFNTAKWIFDIGKFSPIIFLLALIYFRSSILIDVVKSPEIIIFPSNYVEQKTVVVRNDNFSYHLPENTQNCYFNDIPCVPERIPQVILRGEDFSEGFKIKENE